MTPRFMLDTNIASYLLRGSHPALEQRLRREAVAAVCISAITRAELRYGVARLLPAATRLDREVERFLRGITTLAWDDAAADAYGQVRARLERQGQAIGALDTQIAAHALITNLTLITHNVREFQRVAGLQVEDWTRT
ncbi:type II toxin-antitoxin system VapC family toxin [Verticiella sediminum]|uniref:Ribonuclease VapC n=1 Tax=Verticiella sediminum TaxID=1247510 RepID=A0A556B1W8_9BURK|nr:type II toxin-antitoxin system VapC family toxin [Verticiella sediminum]TSH99188.1 type II toxin-antitoxin system VapC family toxin [Verticiella sediminum]